MELARTREVGARLEALTSRWSPDGATTAAALLFVAVTALRFAVPRPVAAIAFLYTLPVLLLALRFGLRGGLAAGLIGFALTALWILVEDVNVGLLGYAVRALVFLATGVVAGTIADRRRQAAAELRYSLDLLEAISDNTTDAIAVVDPDGRYLFANPAAAAMTGVPPEQMVGRLVGELAPEPVREVVDSANRRMADADGPVEEVEDVEVGDEIVTLRSLRGPLRGAGGEYRGHYAIVRDISETRRRDEYRRVYGEIGDALVRGPEPHEVPGIVVPRLAESRDVVWASHWLPGGDGEWVCTVSAARTENGPPHRAGDRWPEGEGWWEPGTRWLPAVEERDRANMLIAMPPHGVALLRSTAAAYGADGLYAISRSISDIVTGYLERRRLEAEADRVKNEFFSLISHELRTPLTSIIGYSELLAEVEGERLSDQGRRFLEVVDRNARRELRLVQDLLLLVRMEGGSFNLDLQEIDLVSVLADACEAVEPQADAKGIGLRTELPPSLHLRGDVGRLGQALDNLLTNAVKFTPSGGTVSVAAEVASDRVWITVADTGIGVADEEIERLFDRLFRASSAVEQQIPGTGLGLTIVGSVVEAHGGSIAVSSREGEGTMFAIELPLDPGVEPEEPTARQTSTTEGRPGR
jgi:PAS domain S-box-containing protein